MKLKLTPELHGFLMTYFPDSDLEADDQTTRKFITASTPACQQQVIDQAKQLLQDSDFPLDEIGSEANRWFADSAEAKVWLRQIVSTLEAAKTTSTVIVKDSNGTALSEGDSVLVIKDLKVKGGSSDLKRGMMIKKIHLIDDPDNIECRVEGSTLVLKTCFLKKA